MAGVVGWYLEDAVPGSTMGHRGGRTIGADEHARLAWLTDNASDVHGDAHRASQGAFGRPLVLGALSFAIVSGLAAPATPPPHLAVRAVGTGWRRIALTAPVFPGDTVHASSRVTSRTDAVDGGGFVDRIVTGWNQRDDAIVIIEERCWAPSRNE